MSKVGRMRHRVQLQKNTPVDQNSGGRVPSWATEATLWADVKGPKTKSSFNQEQRKQVTEYTITCRNNALIQKGKRFLHGSLILIIQKVSNPDQLTKYMQIVCEQEVAQDAAKD